MHHSSIIRSTCALLVLLVALMIFPQATMAQLSGFNIRGDMGLKAGSQPHPGGYFGVVGYWYLSNRINNRFGSKINPAGDLTMFLGGPLFSYVTPYKFLGANYGFTVLVSFANSRIETPRVDINPSPGLSDMYVQPLSLGWHFKRADLTTGYGFFAPTGRYKAGASDNTGLGMWGHEVSLGTTIYLTENKAWHVATSGAVDFHTKKKDVPDKVGTLLTLEGGLGRNIFKGLGSVGLAYTAQWKLTQDTLSGALALLVTGKNRTAGLGPEVNLPLVAKKTLFGLFTFRYEWEVYARTTTQGSTVFAMLTFLTKPISLVPPPPPNRPPTASCSASPQSVSAGSGNPVLIRVDASDPDNDTLTYAWTASGGSLEGTGPGVRWSSAGLDVGSYRFTANVSDGKGGTASCETEVRVEPKPNTPPTLTCSMERNSVLAGELVRINVLAEDADADPLNYSWQTSGGKIVGTGNKVQLDTSSLSAGQYTVTGRVDDGHGGTADCSASLGVTVPPPPPQASKTNECMFRASSARVDNVCKAILDDITLRLQSEPRASVVLVGYADRAERATDKLSASRPAAIAKYLAEKGISEARVKTRAGAAQSGAGMQNQRVDVVWVPEGATY
ncbi:MAG: transporter [Acidobacteriia bacterium]|nr:transporter [Terriglobia bacterium]